MKSVYEGNESLSTDQTPRKQINSVERKSLLDITVRNPNKTHLKVLTSFSMDNLKAKNMNMVMNRQNRNERVFNKLKNKNILFKLQENIKIQDKR